MPRECNMNISLISLSGVSKNYVMEEDVVHCVAGGEPARGSGRIHRDYGRSGSGKSTLMNILGCLDVPTSGTYMLEGNESIGWAIRGLRSCVTEKWVSSFNHSTCSRVRPR